MTYCISDIHGNYDLFIKLLNKINFSKNDTLLILGDIIDKGNDSIKLLKYIFSFPNMICILGNHEYDFLKYYNSLMQKYEDYVYVLNKLKNYFIDGYLLTWNIIDQLESLDYFLEYEDFICIHAGIPVNKNKTLKNIHDVTIKEAVYDRHFKDIENIITDKCIIFGHTPVRYITNNDNIIFYPKNNKTNKTIKDYYKIHIDTGNYISNVLGCLCIDTMETFYVK